MNRTYLSGGANTAVHAVTVPVALAADEVLVRITHSGVCATDFHDSTDARVAAACGLGHEGVGIVARVGAAVTAVRVGDRVGCGWQMGCCRVCPQCIAGERQYCAQAVGQKYGGQAHGTFCDYAVRRADFVNPIPAALESRLAGPLLCGGVTVYEALCAADARAADHVGVVGLGGLGHLAVQYARAMGCAVTVVSGSARKQADAEALGATGFVVLPRGRAAAGDTAPARPASAGINVLLLCGSGMGDIGALLPLLARRARIVPVVVQGEPLTIPYMEFLLPGHRLIAGATYLHEREALQFAARHQIRPWIEEFPMSLAGLQQAFARLGNGSIRFRAVLSRDLGDDIRSE